MEKEDKHRVFVALDFPDSVIKEVARLQDALSNIKFVGKMTELENLHLTLKFFGEIDRKRLESVRSRLGEIRMERFVGRVGEIGVFNFRKNPRIVWVKIEGEGIFELQKKIDEAMEKEGFKREERFMSHMTIARVKYVKDRSGFLNYVRNIIPKVIEFEVRDFKLKESRLESIGPVYRDLEVYGFF